MDLSKVTLLSAMKRRMGWLNQRQKTLAENIANADTPDYRPQDLKPLTFKQMVGSSTSTKVSLAVTNPGHIVGHSGDSAYRENEKRSYESAPAGNAVVLEEEAIKVSETNLDHQLTTELYRKHLTLFKTAIGRQ
ncbi:MAG: flagellar basal body protein [Magnetospiraceae bacterium]